MEDAAREVNREERGEQRGGFSSLVELARIRLYLFYTTCAFFCTLAGGYVQLLVKVVTFHLFARNTMLKQDVESRVQVGGRRLETI